MAIRDADRNLLFGVLALQMDFISREALVSAVTEWTSDRSRPLDRILIGQRALTETRRTLLESLVNEHLKAHGDDAGQSLAAVPVPNTVRKELGEVGDPEVQISLVQSSGSAEEESTVAWVAGSSTSEGTRFRILRPHAKGGIGLVSVALDAELNREVALKEILPEQADDPTSRARFVLEAEVTGRLEHPGVVPVYGLGSSPTGRPYYAMRLIKGDSLKEAIVRFHAQGEKPLVFRGLLNRFVGVCNAVAYAHSRGILHRDLKPANVMLGPYGETLVVDWGLAKVIGRNESAGVDSPEATLRPAGSGSGSSETVAGSTVGTPAYMSPEQAEGRLDALGPVSDVYSLGATLYCLLTGRSPFPEGDIGTILRLVQRGEFPAPRAVNRGVSRALEAVCLQAMALRPQGRYNSARALAEDLEHWLADEPVTAYAEPVPTRLARWGRRHRSLVTGAAALLLTTLAALMAGLVLLGQAGARTEQQRRLAEANFIEAQRQRDLARDNFQIARRAVDDYFVQVSQSTLLKSPLPGLQPLREQLLESALKYYQEFVRRGGNDPGLQAELAQAYFRVGSINAELGKPDEALAAFRRSRDLYEALSRADPGNGPYRSNLARAYRGIGRMEVGTRQPPAAAMASFREAIELGERLIGDHPEVSEYQDDLAWGYSNLGSMIQRAGDPASARRFYEQAIGTWERLVGKDPRAELRYHLGQGYSNFGWNRCLAGRLGDALEASRKAVALCEEVVREDRANPDYQSRLGVTLDNLGSAAYFSGKPAQAKEAFLKALAVAEPLARDNPARVDCQEIVIAILNDFGHLLLMISDDAEAGRCFEDARERTKKLPDIPRTYSSPDDTFRGLGKLHRKQGRTADALNALKEAVRIGETSPGEPPYSTYGLACARALCSAAVGEGKAVPTAEEQATKQRYADQAMEALRQAVAGGWENLPWMKIDPDLDSLRSRDDFQVLIRSLEDKAKTAGEKNRERAKG